MVGISTAEVRLARCVNQLDKSGIQAILTITSIVVTLLT